MRARLRSTQSITISCAFIKLAYVSRNGWEDWETENAGVKPVFEIRQNAIGGAVTYTMPDGTTDLI
jgi:hypothetical protein